MPLEPDTELEQLRRRVAALEAEVASLRPETDELLRLVINGMPGLVSYVDRDFRYRFVNRRYLDWLGPDTPPLEGRTVLEVFGREIFEEVLPYMRRALAGESLRFEMVRNYRPGFPPRHIRATYMPDAAPGGAVRGFVVLMEDITKYHHAQQALLASEERFRGIVEACAEGIWIVDMEAVTVFVNQRMADMLGYPASDMVGRSSLDFFHADDRPRAREGLRLRRTGDTRTREYRALSRDGVTVWLSVTGNAVRDTAGKPTAIVAMCTDVSERKAAEEALVRSNRELQEFAYIASHDLQEPLRTINTFTQLLVRRLDPHMTAETREFASLVDASVKRMIRLIHDLLHYSRVSHESSPQPSLCDLNHACNAALFALRVTIEDAAPAIRCSPLPCVLADEVQIAQVFQNILGNALKYRHPARRLEIDITTLACGPDWVVRIHDNGTGFRADYADRIFGLFKRLQSGGEGTGLGLAISKRIVERYGGQIWADGAEGEGATFYFRLPAAPTKLDSTS